MSKTSTLLRDHYSWCEKPLQRGRTLVQTEDPASPPHPPSAAAACSSCARALNARAAELRRRRGRFRGLSAAPSGPPSSARGRRSLFASTDQSPRILRSARVQTPRLQVRDSRNELLALWPCTGLEPAGAMRRGLRARRLRASRVFLTGLRRRRDIPVLHRTH